MSWGHKLEATEWALDSNVCALSQYAPLPSVGSKRLDTAVGWQRLAAAGMSGGKDAGQFKGRLLACCLHHSYMFDLG